jgi:hypothetical protein
MFTVTSGKSINTTGATSGTRTVYLYGAPGFTPSFNGIRVAQYLALYACFVDRCLSICTFPFDHCIFCPSI